MSVFLSASSIRDYLSCAKRVDFRINSPEKGEQTEPMLLGNIVHATIEKYWDDAEKGLNYASSQIALHSLKKAASTKIDICINSFYNNYSKLLEETDLIEHRFKLRLPNFDDVYIVGKFDRVSDRLVFDWKTGFETPENLSNDIQFIIYYNSFFSIFNRTPISIFYVSLLKSKIIPYVPEKYYIDLVYNNIIPEMVNDIKKGNLQKTGLFTGACKNCSFFKHCMKEIENVVENSNSFAES